MWKFQYMLIRELTLVVLFICCSGAKMLSMIELCWGFTLQAKYRSVCRKKVYRMMCFIIQIIHKEMNDSML